MILRLALKDHASQLVGGRASLFNLQSKRLLDDNALVECPGIYNFEFSEPSTLSLTLSPYPDQESQTDCIDDYARNLNVEARQLILSQWQKTGFQISTTSCGGRAKGEMELFAHIAICIAKLTRGWIVVQDNGVFRQPVGIYSGDEFIPSAGGDELNAAGVE